MSKGLLRSTTVFSAMTFISRVLGFVRDMVFAYVFGAHGGFDAFVLAFKIPNFMRGLFAEGAFSQAFVPVLSEYHAQRSETEVKAFIDRMAGTLAVLLLLTTLVLEAATPIIVTVFAPGFIDDPLRFALASDMLRVTFPYLMLISLTAFCGSVLNSVGRFAAPAFNPVLLNVALIGAAVVASAWFEVPVKSLAWGVFFGGVIQFLFLIPFLYRKGLLPRPRWGWSDSGVRHVLGLMVPALFGVSIAQIGLLMDTLFASFLEHGSISWLYYSQQLTFFPLGVFGVALATVVLPHLSRHHAKKSKEGFDIAFDWALRSVLVIALPSAVGLILLAGPLLVTLFNSGGAFTAHDVMMARLSLIAFSIGVPGFMLVKVLASGFYSRQNIKTPVRIGAIALISNIVLNCLLFWPLKHAGIALATALSSSLNAALLFYQLHKLGLYSPRPGWKTYLLRLGFANLILIMALVAFVPATPEWMEMGKLFRVLHLMAWVLGSVAVYLFCLYLSGLRLGDFRVKDNVLERAESS
jgi:putative peptidoglycan lipid II flippase